MNANTTGHTSLSSGKKIDITDKNSTSSEVRAYFTKQISTPSGMNEDIIEEIPATQPGINDDFLYWISPYNLR